MPDDTTPAILTDAPLLRASEDRCAVDDKVREERFALLFELVLRTQQAPHALPIARRISGAANFLYAFARHLRHAPLTGREAEFIARRADRLPLGPLQRAALYRFVSDLLWEIEQPQAS